MPVADKIRISIDDTSWIIQMFEENIWLAPSEPALCPFGLSRQECDTLEALARYNLGLEGGRQYYKYVDTMVKNGLPYFYSIIAYDHQVEGGVPIGPGRYNTPASNFAYAVPRSDAQTPEQFREDNVYVVPNPGKTVTLASIVAFMKEQGSAVYKLPERIEVVEAIPRNPVGKIVKKALRKDIAEKLAPKQ